MSRLLAIACSLLLAAGPARAEDTAVPPGARAAWEQMSKVQRLEASFEQSRTSDLVSRPLVSQGTLRFERPDKLAWIVTSPARSTLIVNGTRLLVDYPDLGVREQVELSGDPNTERLVRSMMVWLAGDLDDVARDYAIQWSEGPPATALLTPRDPTLGALLGQLSLDIAGDPLRVTGVDIIEPDGDAVHIRLSAVRIDPDLPADTFGTGR